MPRTIMVSWAAAMLLVWGSGCIKRHEHIRIHADGSAVFTSTFEGDPVDVHKGDAPPSEAAGWTVQDRTSVDKEDRETLTRTAVYTAKPNTPFPHTYAVGGSPLEPMALTFPTGLQIEQRPDGTYYHFKRVYSARRWAPADYPGRQVMQRDEITAITAQQPDGLDAEQQAKLVEALLEAHAGQHAAHLETAYAALEGQLPPDAFLAARQAAVDVIRDDAVRDQAVALSGQEDNGTAMEALAEQVLGNVRAAVRNRLNALGMRAGDVDAFFEQYELARQTFEITEDLNDEEWVVHLEMPGRIIAHNGRIRAGHLPSAEAPTQQPDLGRPVPAAESVEWKFDGEALHDRDVVLMATSVMPR